VGKGAKPKASTTAQGGRSKNKNKNKKKKKVGGNNQPLAGAPTATATAVKAGGVRGPRGEKRPRQASGGDDGGVIA
jgi:hypothetical protein